MFKPISNLLTLIINNPDSEELLADRYELKYFLGKGAMGQVYCAADRNLNDTNVAVKFLSQALLGEEARVRFEKEAKISTLLGEQSNYIVKVKDYGLDKRNVPFYVMEFLQGDSLDKVIKKNTLSLTRFLSFIRQICLALECAHNGILVEGQLSSIIHRDIKPSNVFLVKDPDGGDLVKILDFGIAQVINPSQSINRDFMGTLQYSSPEQLAEEQLDPRSDIYSLGVMMYEMLTRKLPIEAENKNFQGWYYAHHNLSPKPLPRYLNLPSDLEKIIMGCLEKSPDNRPQSAVDILKVINNLEREDNGQKSPIKIPQKTVLKKNLSLQEKYRQISWPHDKPQQKIVFPALTESNEGLFTSLWAMLETEDIVQYNPRSTFCFNHFLFQISPHPMLLWVNLLYSSEKKEKWLPCYLDLKAKSRKKIVENLVQNEFYHILLFVLNKPEKPQQIITGRIAQDKIREIQKYLYKSMQWQGKKQPEVTKKLLKEQFEQVKIKIMKIINKVKVN